MADLAYEGCPHLIVPIKDRTEGFGLSAREEEFNRVLQFYRARVEHVNGWLNNFGIVRQKCRMHNLTRLEQGMKVLCNLRNLYTVERVPYNGL